MNGRASSRSAGRFGVPPRLAWAMLVSLLLAAPALVLAFMPGASERFDYQRSAVAAGELWRAITCHWTHWSADHLQWDLLAFVPLTVLAWFARPGRAVIVLALSAVTIPLAVWVALPEMAGYRGLSGLDSALFVFVAINVYEGAVSSGRRVVAGTVAMLAIGFVGKVLFELATGTAFFVDTDAFVPVPLAHIVGAACGAMGAFQFVPTSCCVRRPRAAVGIRSGR